MRIPAAAELLAAWEEGGGRHPVERALLLLGLMWPERPASALAALSIGERDAQLLALREVLFGPRLFSAAVCPACGERLEFDFDIADICAPAPPHTRLTGEVSVAAGDYLVRCRLPASADLLAIADAGDASAARQMLLERCVLAIERAGAQGEAGEVEAVELTQLPPAVVESVVERMREADPQADTQLSLNCPACGHAWQQVFDIASYLWAELGDWARRTLREVHALASAYGWREADILAMSAQRRQWYLEMIGT
jgi:hypothetical protein